MGLFNRNKNKKQLGNVIVKPEEVKEFTNYKQGKSPTIQVVGGETQRDTQGNVVVTSKETSASVQVQTGNVQDTINKRGSGSSGVSTRTQSSLSNPTEGARTTTQTQTEVNPRTSTQSLRDKGGLSKVKVLSSGGVRVGDREYVGNAYIQEVGMTANEYRDRTREYLISQGTDKNKLREGRYSMETQVGEEKLESGEIVIYNNFGEPIGVKSKIFGQTLSLENYNKKIDEYNSKITKEITTESVPINPKTGKPYSVLSKVPEGRKKVYGGGEFSETGEYLYSGSVSSLADWTGTGIRPKISEKLNTLGFPGKVVDVLVPKTMTGVVLTVGGGLAYSYLPSILKTGVSTYFTYTGTRGAFNPELSAPERVASGVVGGLGVLGLGNEGGMFFKKWTTPYIKTAQLEPINPFAFERISTIERGGQNIRVSEYKQFVEREPQTIEITTNRLREKYPKVFKPIKIEVKPSKFSEFSTIEPTELGTKNAFGIVEVVKGRKFGTVYGLKGKSVVKQTEIEDIEVSKSIIESSKIMRVSKQSKKVISIKTPVVEGFKGFLPNLEFTEANTLTASTLTPSGLFKISKSVTKFEGGGKLKTTSFEEVVPEEKGFEFIKGSGRSSDQFFEELYNQKQVQKQLPKLNINPKTSTLKSNQLEITDELPLMVGGRGLKDLGIYAGTGQYEVTELGRNTLTVQPQNVMVENVLDKQVQENTGVSRERINIQFKSPQLELLKGSQKNNLKVNEQLKTPTQEKVRENLKEIELLKVNQQLKQQLKVNQQLKLKQQFKQVQKLQFKVKPVITEFKVPIPPKNNIIKKLSKKVDEGEFEAFAFKLGKEVSVAKGTREQVSSELKGFLQNELSASGFLTKGGKKIKAEETGLIGMEFRKSKTGNKFLIVEEKPLRLRRGGTGKSIQYFR